MEAAVQSFLMNSSTERQNKDINVLENKTDDKPKEESCSFAFMSTVVPKNISIVSAISNVFNTTTTVMVPNLHPIRQVHIKWNVFHIQLATDYITDILL